MSMIKSSRPTPTSPPDPIIHKPKDYKGVTVDSEYKPVSTLALYLEGSSWTVDYFSQVLGTHDTAQPWQERLDAVYQQYKLVRGFELKVTSPLSPSQDSDTKTMNLVGSANFIGVIAPNEGDVFLADIGDGHEGMFCITNSTKKSMYADSAYEVEYVLIRYSNEAIRADLDRKAIDTLYFDRNYLSTGNNPLLRSHNVQQRVSLSEHYSHLTNLYFTDFYSRTNRTLLIPDQPRATYDPFLVNFVRSMLTTEDHPVVRELSELNVFGNNRMYDQTLWNALLRMDHRLVAQCHREMIVARSGAWSGRAAFNSIALSRIERVIYPAESSTNVDRNYYDRDIAGMADIQEGASRFMELGRQITQTELPDESSEGPMETRTVIHPVTHDNFYVLSGAFYQGTGGQSLLEQSVTQALKHEPIDLDQLNLLCRASMSWTNLERFYYIPILLLLIRIHPRGY